jgi:hypothetical protein
MLAKGHAENVRQDGDFLVADLYITDAGLISEIENGKREVSCGYDCLWVPAEDGTFEQKEIVGNHVAVVQTGRAGPRVAIKDSRLQKRERGNKPMKDKKVTKSFLQALGFKTYVQDAEPEDVAKAMDALGESDEEIESPEEQKNENNATAEILAAIKSIGDRLTALENSNKNVHEEVGADAEFANLEKEIKDADPEEEEAETVEPEEKKEKEESKSVADSALAKFVQDMKPIIMSIPDEKTRNETAKAFAKSIRDAKVTGINGYGNIINAVAGNKKKAMDEAKNNKIVNQAEASQKQVDAWNQQNAHYNKGGK